MNSLQWMARALVYLVQRFTVAEQLSSAEATDETRQQVDIVAAPQHVTYTVHLVVAERQPRRRLALTFSDLGRRQGHRVETTVETTRLRPRCTAAAAAPCRIGPSIRHGGVELVLLRRAERVARR